MRILILGAGGGGGYLGAQLIRHTDAEVSFVARGEHLEAIRRNGLEILEDNERYRVSPDHATDDPSELGIFELIIVTVKSTGLEESLALISKNIDSKTVMIPLLNGVDHDRDLRRVYPDADILNGCIYILSNIVEPGVIRKKGSIFNLCWGRAGIDPESYRQISELFDAAGLRHKATANIDYEVWRKFLFISPMAALTSLYGIPMDRVVTEHPEELRELMEEIHSIAEARQIPLGREDLEQTLQRMQKTLPGAKTSMQLDIEQGKPAEIETLVGHPVHEGERLGVATPLYRKVYEKLQKK